ncbi:hypothetical protein [Geobacter sp. SVR]|uniref:hypothetical protein n=1 Tax=Geobacter sp. SVR TaxID=2495594 RepID=UPI00143EF72B|nr:hypothetical protein [Geobacter sp. SVR]BCS54336.1 hypothetical protein GSVR_26440 [Geobacter sp. SVR]GCF85805.1 hypothetical protein GSbR_24050 [Geobacter sp. SVR]
MNKAKIFIATPCFGGQLTQSYMQSIISMMTSYGTQVDLSLALLGNDALITRARSTLIGKFMDDESATHLLFIDSDIGFNPAQFARLFCANRDFVAAMYPIKEFDWHQFTERHSRGESIVSAGLNYVGTLCEGSELKVEDSFATARYAGGGFQLIKRSVIETLMFAYPHLKYQRIHSNTKDAPSERHLFALFDPFIDERTGEYISEDYAFCTRWRRLGGEIWLDLKSQLIHVGSNDYMGNSSIRFSSPGKSGDMTSFP